MLIENDHYDLYLSPMKKKDFIQEITWRGLVHDQTPALDAQLGRETTRGYIGFDPTAASLHIGNLVPIMLLVHFQRAGHRPIALVGGATGMVGDPSGKLEERKLLDEETLRHNQAGIRRQLEKFLDFTGPNAAEVVNNYDWFGQMGFLDFLRDVGKHLTVNYMMAKDSVRKRLETGLSFTEFSYQLLQGYDYYYLYQHKGCRLQMGGSDQWGNITAGTELIRRMGGGEAHALTAPLVTKADGSKFGKSEAGNVWLDPALTSPYQFYQFWLNVSDADAGRMIRIYTLLDEDQILDLEAQQAATPGERPLQKALAADVTTRVHSAADLQVAVQASEVLFGQGTAEVLRQFDERLLLDVLEGVPRVQLSRSQWQEATDLPELLGPATAGVIFGSKGEARKMMAAGGVRINKLRVAADAVPAQFDLLHDRYWLVQKGKKQYFLVEITD